MNEEEHIEYVLQEDLDIFIDKVVLDEMLYHHFIALGIPITFTDHTHIKYN